MERITYPFHAILDISPEEAARQCEQNKTDAYNAREGQDDGTGVQCTICRNKGTVALVSEETGRITIRPCRCHAERLTVQRLRQCGLWERAGRCRLEAFRTDTATQRAMMEAARGFLEDHAGRWLAIIGQSGAGKTHVTVGTFCELVRRQGLEGDVLLWNSDGRALKAAALEDGDGLYDRYKKAPLLLIDDLFKTRAGEAPSSADVRLAFELLDARYNGRLTTIISCELDIDRLLALDQAIAGRIRELCGPYLVSIAPDQAKNYRLTGGAG